MQTTSILPSGQWSHGSWMQEAVRSSSLAVSFTVAHTAGPLVELGKKWTKHAAACWFLSLLELFVPFDKQWIRTQNNVWSGHAVSTGGYSSLIAWLFGWGALRTWVQGWEPNDVFTEVRIRLIDILQFSKPMPMYIVRTVCLLILFMFYGQFMYLFICFKF